MWTIYKINVLNALITFQYSNDTEGFAYFISKEYELPNILINCCFWFDVIIFLVLITAVKLGFLKVSYIIWGV